MSKFYYCHVCGALLEKSEVKQIIVRSWTTRKRNKLFDVCDKCANQIEHMVFKPVSFKKHNNISYYTVSIKDFETRKSHKVYDILEQQLNAIKDLEADINELRLVHKSGSRLYTEFQVKKWLCLRRSNLLEGMYLLYLHQTEDEQKNRETKYANSVGFNKPDAAFLTGMSRIYEERVLKNNEPIQSVYTRKQFAAIKERILKYTKQLTLYVNAEGRKLIGV